MMLQKMRMWMAYAQGLGIFSFSSYLWQRFIIRKKIIAVRVAGLPAPVCIRNQRDDHALFSNIFIHKEYGPPVGHRVEVIIDCGANIGLAALYFLMLYPNAHITCIEPDRQNFLLLKMNMAHFKNVKCLQNAAWHEAAVLNIYGYSRGAAGLMVQETDSGKNIVKGIPMSAVIKENDHIDILKIDIEGSEQRVLLQGDTGWIKNVTTMYVELHEDICPGITHAVKEKFSTEFSIHKSGEYHVFQKIKQH